MYYVYALIDPRNDQPFYIGKGTGKRASTHLYNRTKKDRNLFKENKIDKIRSEGLEPYVRIIEDNLDEQTAYDKEKQYIQLYGRKEDGGILTNLCEDNRPPSIRGKSYVEAYGEEKAKEIIEKKRQAQIAAGGWGPKKHSEETKQKQRLGSLGNKHLLGHVHSEETRALMSEAQKSRSREKSKKYILTHEPSNTRYEVLSVDLPELCKQLNISCSTLQNQILKGWGRCKKGKTTGWLLEKTDEVV